VHHQIQQRSHIVPRYKPSELVKSASQQI
jgi:hypothetical protein